MVEERKQRARAELSRAMERPRSMGKEKGYEAPRQEGLDTSSGVLHSGFVVK